MSCFGGQEEQLYLFDIMVGKLTLTPDKIKDVGNSQILVRIKFIDFPIFEISRGDFSFAKQTPLDAVNGSLEFAAGKSCLFTKQPRDLVHAMQFSPLKIAVLRLGDTFPIAEAEVPLSGCLCDQVAMAMNDPDHLPKPYTLTGGFHLSDPGGNPSGSLNFDLRLTCFGKSITTHFQLQPRSFLFKNDKEDSEFCVKRVIPPPLCGNEQIKVVQQNGNDVQMGKCGDSMLPDAFPDEPTEPTAEAKEGKSKGKRKKGGGSEKKAKKRSKKKK